jgi:hypothetical protein
MKLLKNGHKISSHKDEMKKLVKMANDLTGLRLFRKPDELRVYTGMNGEYIKYHGVAYSTLFNFRNKIRKALRNANARYI